VKDIINLRRCLMMRNFIKYAQGHDKDGNIEQEGTQTKRLPKVQKGLIALAVVGVGCGIFGLSRGYRLGYHQGFRKGELYANDQFRALATELIKMREESKGE
jgi:hypothetical protein